MYNNPFYITEPLGNNAFSYEKRTNKILYVPSIMEGSFSDVKRGTEVVFEDVDENGALQSCTGLENFVQMEWNGIPMRVFDNHNHALYFWHEARERLIVGPKNTLIHIDEHSDLWDNVNDIQKESTLEDIFHFTNYQCNVGNYIQPALREGIVERVLRIEDTIGMEKYASYQKREDESIILNLDLDFFARELDYIPFEDKKRTILHFARLSRLITVATSPFFIDQTRAIQMFQRVFDFTDI